MVFACAGCETVLTARVSRVALPDHAHQSHGYDLLPPLLEPGTYTVDPEPSGPPWRPWDEVGAAAAAARGVHAPVFSLPYGLAGRVGVAPGDVRGTVVIPERCDTGCCGPDGRDGPNLACVTCGQPVASRIDDCGLWQVVWLDPRAVRPVRVNGPPGAVMGWADCPSTPPLDQSGEWSPQWTAAAAVTLTHLLAASGGRRMALPPGPVTEVFRKALDTLLPPGAPDRRLTLAGPRLPAGGADLALVPRHPQTGEVWPSRARGVVPLDSGVWTYLAFTDERRLTPAVAGMPGEVRRDDPPPLLPRVSFRLDMGVFLHTLARLPAVREPWLRAVYDRVREHRYHVPGF